MAAGYLGVGAMGQPMAHKLLDARHSLTIYDINEAAMQPLFERQTRRGVSPRDLADRCEMVFVSLPTLAAFREVAFGADGLIHGRSMKLLVNTCTVGLPFMREIEQAMGEHDVKVVDCPISGGPRTKGRIRRMVGSNPLPSSGESANQRFLGDGAHHQRHLLTDSRWIPAGSLGTSLVTGSLRNPIAMRAAIIRSRNRRSKMRRSWSISH
jgi:hypothetical protein